MTIQEKIDAVKKFIGEEIEAAYKVKINLRMVKRRMSNAKDSELAGYGQMATQMSKTLKNSEEYLAFLEEVKAELEAGNDYELKDIPKA